MSSLRWNVVVLLAVVGVVGVWGVSPARAEAPGTGWEALAQVYPTYLHPGGSGTIQIDLTNVGAEPSSGPITVSDTLPEGMTATAAGGMSANTVMSPAEEERELGGARWSCEGIGTGAVTCTSNPTYLNGLPIGGGESFDPFERFGVAVQVREGMSGKFENRVDISGGGAQGVTGVSDPLPVSSSEPAGFGFANWDVWFSNASGTIDTQAGSHPYETTFAFALNETAKGEIVGGELKDVQVELPPGFFGEPNSAPRCTRQEFDAASCSVDTQIGTESPLLTFGYSGGPITGGEIPVYNMVPPPGVVDQFGFVLFGKHVFFDTSPRGYGHYELVTDVNDITAGIDDVGNILTLWGVAPEASHNAARYNGFPKSKEEEICKEVGCPSSAVPRPFLTLPTSCTGPQAFTISGSSWEHETVRGEASVLSHNGLDEPSGFTGCSLLSFGPSLSTAPDTSEADTPTGLGVNVTFPQEALREPGRLVESTVKGAAVTLPPGLVINPGQAAGLQACSEAQARLHEEGPSSCPSASKVGTIKIKTPLLEGEIEPELEGDAYVLAQSNGGPGEPPNLQSHPPTLQLLLTASGDGVYLKLVANVALNEATGQLTTTLAETPELPFSDFELHFSGGAQAALATPASCGAYTTMSDFTPWTSSLAPDLFPSSSFQMDSGPNGGMCPSSPLPFSPELIAGATTDQAGGYTGFSMLLRRGDGQQRIERLQFKVPEGLSGMISAVPLCPAPQAATGECPESSKIGHSVVSSGPGPDPLVIPQPGNPESPIYLTGPYEGAPFGLSIATHVIAGPFNLGTVVTRAKIEVDPHTAQITVTTGALPQVIDGVPTDLRLVDAVIDRPGFMFNPTNCSPMSFSGTAWGAPPPGAGGPGASASISSHFQVGSCRSLEFKPSFAVSTSGKTSRANGASLSVKLTYPKAPQGTQANIAKVKVELPKQLPSRLSTLQKACIAATFEANPANCPATSIVGHAKAITPLLPVPLEGPAYFVSHGGEAFPSLIVVLQGDNVTLDLVGATFISKAGVTSSTFKTVPDAPVGSFELTLPEGPYSALGTAANLCKSKLRMPTEMVAQNGAEIHESTKIAVTGCQKVKKADKHKRHGKHVKRARGKGKKK